MNSVTGDGQRRRQGPLVPVVGKRIRRIIQTCGISVNELARRVGDSPQTINLIVRGDTKRCRSRRLKRIARAIECTDVDYLMGKVDRTLAYIDCSVGSCARCHGNHDSLVFRRFNNGPLKYTHWAICPTTQEPILMLVEDSDA